MSSECNSDIDYQKNLLGRILEQSKIIRDILDTLVRLDIPDYYVGAGCIAQTVWNYLSGFSESKGISDIDIVYFDSNDLSYEAEDKIIKKVSQGLLEIPIKLDVKNQARVHLWYDEYYGYDIGPYLSLEEAINSWPTTATSVGVRKNVNNRTLVYAPYGLNDLFGKIVRANKKQITKEIYQEKVNKWLKTWPDLKVIPWEK